MIRHRVIQKPAWLLLTFLLAFLCPVLAVGELPSQEIMEQASWSVVKVQTRDCEGRPSTASGFLWGRANQVVTALHAVAGCNRIAVYSENAGTIRQARIVRVLKEADLALLSIDNAPDLPTLEPTVTAPRMHDDLVALGYELGAPTMSSKNLKLSFGRSLLSDLLPDPVRREISLAGTPSLSLYVLRLQGHLVPGLSGAPIIDRTGRVVAVGDGGLENGAASISWALPIQHVTGLLTSVEGVSQVVVAARSHFGADLEGIRGETLNCGGMTFTKLRTRSYGELARTTDDPEGLKVFEQIAELANIDMSGLSFDVYVHLSSGATLALPQGVILTRSNGSCVVSEFNGALQMHIRGVWPSDIRSAAQRFLDETMMPTGLRWSPDPLFSYPNPQVRFDGLNVNRASYHGIRASDLMLGMPTAVANAFESIVGRGDAFLGMIIFNYDKRTWNPESVIYCQMYSETPQCRQFNAMIRRWVAMMIGAFLSTFPIG